MDKVVQDLICGADVVSFDLLNTLFFPVKINKFDFLSGVGERISFQRD